MDKYNQKWVSFVFRKPQWAITLFGTTYYSVLESLVDDQWRRHENWHKKQQADEGFWFYPKYFFFAVVKGYANNPYEIEARRAEKGGQ